MYYGEKRNHNSQKKTFELHIFIHSPRVCCLFLIVFMMLFNSLNFNISLFAQSLFKWYKMIRYNHMLIVASNFHHTKNREKFIGKICWKLLIMQFIRMNVNLTQHENHNLTTYINRFVDPCWWLTTFLQLPKNLLTFYIWKKLNLVWTCLLIRKLNTLNFLKFFVN